MKITPTQADSIPVSIDLTGEEASAFLSWCLSQLMDGDAKHDSLARRFRDALREAGVRESSL